MLKRLGIVLMALALVGCNRYADAHKAKQAQGDQNPTLPVSQTRNQQSDSPSPQSKPEQHTQNDVWIVRTPDKDAFDYASLVISMILALVGIVGVGVGIFTLRFLASQAAEMRHQRVIMRRTLNTVRRQTDILATSVSAAQKSADAAKENVELLVNKERGRIFIDVRPFDIKRIEIITQVVEFQVIYHGETVSFHESSSMEIKLTDSVQPPDFNIPSWFKVRGVFEVPPVIPAHSGPFDCTSRLFHKFDQYELDRIAHSQSFVHFFGYIEYKDFMDRTHITAFCYTWKPKPPGLAIGVEHWEKSGPPEANRET